MSHDSIVCCMINQERKKTAAGKVWKDCFLCYDNVPYVSRFDSIHITGIVFSD